MTPDALCVGRVVCITVATGAVASIVGILYAGGIFVGVVGTCHRGATSGVAVGNVPTGGATTSLLPSILSKSNVLVGSWVKDVGVCSCCAHHPLLASWCISLIICISSANDQVCGMVFSVVLFVCSIFSITDAACCIGSSLSVAASFF